MAARPTPASAHGIGNRGDLPLPAWQVAWSAGFAVAMSFIALGLLWTAPRMARAAKGRPIPDPVGRVVRAAGEVSRWLVVALFVLVLADGWSGTTDPSANLAPVTVYIVFWVGGQLGSALLGDLWARLSPVGTIAGLVARLTGRRPARPGPSADPETGWVWTHWPAAVGLSGFLWLELAYHTPASPRVLAIALSVYSAVLLAGALRWGPAWLRVGDGFAVLFGLLAAMAPLFRADDGSLKVRWPFSGLATITPRPGTIAVIMVTLGGTSFDGVSRTQQWKDLIGNAGGWALTAYNTVGLAAIIAVVALLYYGAIRWGAAITGERAEVVLPRYVHSLVPIMLAYSIAHYFSLLVFEGQAFLSLISNPLGVGWDLLGTAGRPIDYLLVSTAVIAWVQVVTVVVGHIVGVTAAHDRAVETTSASLAVRSQYPMLAVMVVYTVGALILLLRA